MTTATHARFMDYGRLGPDPTTATCTQHAVGAPENSETKATNKAQPLFDNAPAMECTVCGTENADLIGKVVIDSTGRTYLYAGPHDHPAFRQIEIAVYRGLPAVLRCAPTSVAPAEEITVPDPKDPRLVVTKRAQHEVPSHHRPGKAGMWESATSDGVKDYHKTKKEATSEGQYRLAILDWHAARKVQA